MHCHGHLIFVSNALRLSMQRRWGKHGERARRKPLVTSRPFPFVALFPIVAPKTQNCSSFKCKTLPHHPVIVLLLFFFVFFFCSYGAVANTHSPYYHSVTMILRLGTRLNHDRCDMCPCSCMHNIVDLTIHLRTIRIIARVKECIIAILPRENPAPLDTGSCTRPFS